MMKEEEENSENFTPLSLAPPVEALQPKETGVKRTRTSSLDSDTWSVWGSASEYSGHAYGRQRLSEGGLDFRLMGRKEERNFSDEEDDASLPEELENWDSDNATADENSEMFEGDDLNLVDWSGDEAENEIRTDVEGTRIDSALSQEISVVSPFSPIAKSETASQTTLRRRRASRKMDREINDTLSMKVRRLGKGDGEDSLIDGVNNKTPFKRASDSVGYFSESSSSSHCSSRTAQSHFLLPVSSEASSWRERFNSSRLAGDVTHSECIASEDGGWNE